MNVVTWRVNFLGCLLYYYSSFVSILHLLLLVFLLILIN